MPVSHKYKCIFVHIPKTAGTSVEFALGMHGDIKNVGINPVQAKKNRESFFGGGLQHAPAKNLMQKIKNYNQYFSFSFVRNPWDRFVSAAAFRGSLRKARRSALEISIFRKNFKSLLLNNKKNKHFFTQSFYLYDREELLVNFVGKFENLEADFGIVSQALNLSNICLEKRMSTPPRRVPYQEFYTSEMRDAVGEKYSQDIKNFNYSFD